MALRATVVLLLLAALLGAPPRASAAANQLLDPTASPTAGTTATVFTFRVRYEGAFGAIAVTTTVAGITLPMARTAGTATAGTWTAATALPAGTWQPTFAAVAAQGNQPTLVGPSIAVAGLAPTAQPTDASPDLAPVVPPSSGPERTAPVVDGAAPTAVPAPAAPVATSAPSATTGPAAPTGPAALATPALAPSGSGSAISSPAGGSSGTGSSGTVTTPGFPAGDGTGPAAQPAAPGATPAPAPGGGTFTDSPTPAGSRGPGGSEPVGFGVPSRVGDGAGDGTEAGTVLAIGLSGVAAVALVGLALLLARRRREEDDRAPAAVHQTTPDAPRQRRPSRRASIDLPDDPIVAALGLGRTEPRDRGRRDRRPD